MGKEKFTREQARTLKSEYGEAIGNYLQALYKLGVASEDIEEIELSLPKNPTRRQASFFIEATKGAMQTVEYLTNRQNGGTTPKEE